VGIPEFAVRKHQYQAKNFKREQIFAALEDAAQTEEAVKTGRLQEKIAVEIFIVKYSKEDKKN